MFSPLTFRVLVVGVIVWSLMRRQRRLAFYLFVSIELTGVLTEIAKFVADRPRPATALVSASSTSDDGLCTSFVVLAACARSRWTRRPTSTSAPRW